MKNKTIVIILFALGVALAVLIGIYFIRQNKSPVNPSENAAQQNQNGVPANSASENAATNQAPASNPEGTTSGTEINKQTDIEQPQDKLVTNDFEVDLPTGWRQTAPAMGASAMAVNVNEHIDDPAAQNINFKILMVIVKGQGDDVWVMSFNTTKSSWEGYKKTFYDIANSFSLKK